MPTVYIAFGSNLGDRQKNIDRAIALLNKTDKVTVKKISSIYETDPVGGPKQGKFLNGVAEINTTLGPEALLEVLNKIEGQLERVRTEHWGPRTIDLDILLYGDLNVKKENLIIPHPRMMERGFVLNPLKEIAPQLKIFQK